MLAPNAIDLKTVLNIVQSSSEKELETIKVKSSLSCHFQKKNLMSLIKLLIELILNKIRVDFNFTSSCLVEFCTIS